MLNGALSAVTPFSSLASLNPSSYKVFRIDLSNEDNPPLEFIEDKENPNINRIR